MKVALVGYGAMGKIIKEKLKDNIIGIVSDGFLTSLDEIASADCIIDFSHPNNLTMICQYAQKKKSPVVIATTGYNDEQLKQIKTLSQTVPVLHSSNFSFGVTILNRVIKSLAPVIDNFDVEIIEKHHNQKLDSPSGTAKMLLESCNPKGNVIYGRQGLISRQKNEIAIHSVRGGSIVGEHEVLFATTDETLSFKHTAQSKTIFASGAIAGAQWLCNQKPGLYNMDDFLFGGK